MNLRDLDLSDETLRIFKSLPPRQLECFVLHFVYNLKYKEIAKELGISKGTAHNHIVRAKKTLLTTVPKHPKISSKYIERQPNEFC